MIKITVPGPFTMAQQAQDDFYGSREALAFGYAAAITTALVEGARGMMAAAEFVEEEAKVAANAGINILDAAVDAVDGPQRHGIR